MSTRAFPKFVDGYYGTARRISRTPYRYPFRGNGDTTTKLYEATYLVDLGKFSPTAAGTEDPENSGHYLIFETQPEIFQGELATFRRTYSSIPSTQSVTESIMVNRPSPGLETYPGVLGAARIFQPDTTLKRFDAYLAQTVTSDTGAPGFYPSGGTYDLTFAGSTASGIAYNAAAATVQTALNALTPISNRGGVTVTGTYNSSGGFTVTFANYAAATLNTGSLTGGASGSTPRVTTAQGGFYQLIEVGGFNGLAISGGTYTITIFGQTTASIAYDASASAIASALNALSEVSNRGSCTVSYGAQDYGSPGSKQLYIVIEFANSAITGSGASLTPAGSTISAAITDSPYGRVQTVQLVSSSSVRDLICTAHGITTADAIYIKGASSFYGSIAGSTKFLVPDVNTIRLLVAPSDAYASVGTITEVGKRTKHNYEPGAAPVQVTKSTRFSLSTITPDTWQGADATFLQQIFAGNTAINYQVGDSQRWPSEESPIRALTTVKVSASVL